MTDNAKELILSKVNAGNKLAKMYLYLITLGADINDIVKFMTSPVANFIDSITEENIFGSKLISLKDAIKIAQEGVLNNQGKYRTDFIKKWGTLRVMLIENLYKKSGLDNKEARQEILADCAEFANVLEGANEFSNFALLLGLNQGIPTSKIDLQKKLSSILNMFDSRINEVLSKKDISTELKNKLQEVLPMDVERYLNDSKYRDYIKQTYDLVKKTINIFDAFESIPLFDAIREILSAVVLIDKTLSFKSKAFNAVYKRAKEEFKFISENYQNKLLQAIDKVIIDKFISSLNIRVPVLKGTPYILGDRNISLFKENGFLNLDNNASVASFKYMFENTIIPKLKKGIVVDIDKNGNIFEHTYNGLSTNKFVNALIKSRDKGVSLFKVDLNMLTLLNSAESQQKFISYSSALLELSKYKVGDNNLADLFVLYNLIINRNQYGANRLTSLFDNFIKSGTGSKLMYNYLSYIGNLDYYAVPRLDVDTKFDPSLYDENTPIIDLSYKDILIDAAPQVNSLFDLKDPYVILNAVEGPIIMLSAGYGNYTKIEGYLKKMENESLDNYLERLYNEKNYFVLEGQFTDYLLQQLNVIRELKDPNTIISYINDFIRKGYLTIYKVCD